MALWLLQCLLILRYAAGFVGAKERRRLSGEDEAEPSDLPFDFEIEPLDLELVERIRLQMNKGKAQIN